MRIAEYTTGNLSIMWPVQKPTMTIFAGESSVVYLKQFSLFCKLEPAAEFHGSNESQQQRRQEKGLAETDPINGHEVTRRYSRDTKYFIYRLIRL